MKTIIKKVIYHGSGEGFWTHESFSRYISGLPNSLNVSIERKKQGANPMVHVWSLVDYEVDVSYERKCKGEQAYIKIILEGKEENIEALGNKIISDSGLKIESISQV